MTYPIFSDKQRESNGEILKIRCDVDKKVWLSFKTLIGLKRLDVKNVLSDIIRQWVINFGEVKYVCVNCGMITTKDNCYIIVKDGVYLSCCSVRCFDMVVNDMKENGWKKPEIKSCMGKC